MPTNRTPIHRPPRRRISPRAVELFREMQALPHCSCLWGPMYWDRVECASCDRWWSLQNNLCRELELKPWEFPAVSTHPIILHGPIHGWLHDAAPRELKAGRNQDEPGPRS
jgi:hypothetical protein